MRLKVLFSLALLVILLVGTVSAFDWSTNVQSYWKFDETGGLTASDSVDGDNDGNLLNMSGSEWTTGALNNAIDFDGTDDVIAFDFTTADWNWDNFSVSLWVKVDNQAGTRQIFARDPTGGGYCDLISDTGTTNFRFAINNVSHTGTATGGDIFDNAWHHIVITRDVVTRNMTLYVDGSVNASTTTNVPYNTISGDNRIGPHIGSFLGTSRQLTGLIDEMAVFTRVLNGSEVIELYNSGTPLAYGNQDITLNNPDDASDQLSNVTFNITVAVTGGANFTNMTLYLNSTLNETQTITGTSNTTLFYKLFSYDTTHSWYVRVCDDSVLCSNSTTRTFTSKKMTFDTIKYTASTLEGNTETFYLNITVDTGLAVSTATLHYNNTNYAGTLDTSLSPIIQISRELVVPDILAKSNITFYWNVTLDDSSEFQSNSTNQTVDIIAIDNCTSYTIPLFNFTLVDEELKTQLDANATNSTFEVDINLYSSDRTSNLLNYSTTFNETNPGRICLSRGINEGITYSLDGQVRYEADGYAAEFYHFQNHTVSNTTLNQNISLYDLDLDDSTEFLITYKGADLLPVSDALIQITRKYVGDGVFRTVEIPKTDLDGQAIAHLDLDSVIYTIIISKNGEVLSTYENVAVVCQDETIGDCNINLKAAATTTDFQNFEESEGLDYTISFDETLRRITFVFTTSDGGTKVVNLTSIKYDAFSNTTVCSDQLTTSAGTLTCDIPISYGNVTVVTTVTSDGSLALTRTYTIDPTAGDIFGSMGLVLLLILLMTIPFMFAANKIGVLIGAIIGLLAAGLLLIVDTGSSLGDAAPLLWFVIAIGIVIWKISKTEDGV